MCDTNIYFLKWRNVIQTQSEITERWDLNMQWCHDSLVVPCNKFNEWFSSTRGAISSVIEVYRLCWCLTFRVRMQTYLSNTVIFSEVEHELLGSYRPGGSQLSNRREPRRAPFSSNWAFRLWHAYYHLDHRPLWDAFKEQANAVRGVYTYVYK